MSGNSLDVVLSPVQWLNNQTIRWHGEFNLSNYSPNYLCRWQPASDTMISTKPASKCEAYEPKYLADMEAEQKEPCKTAVEVFKWSPPLTVAIEEEALVAFRRSARNTPTHQTLADSDFSGQPWGA
jgi:hypothetical protein